MNEQDFFSSMSHQVFTNWLWLEKGEVNSKKWLSEQIYHLYCKISLTTFFKQKSQITPDKINKSKGYSWIPVYEDEKCRAGLLYLPAKGVIPMHDHKKSVGISLVLNGNPVIFQSHLSKNKKRWSGLLKTNQVMKKKLQPGDTSFIFPKQNNIHGFHASDSPCLLFNIIFFSEKKQRNYYLPLDSIHENTKKDNSLHFLKKSFGYPIIINFLLSGLSLGICDKNLLGNKPVIETTENQIVSLIKCSEAGDVTAQFKLAKLYAAGSSKSQDFYDAFYWYLQAAENGHADAQYHVGIMLLDGIGVTQDSFEAIDWLFKSSQNGHIKATAAFNYIMENPEPIEC